MLTLGQLIDKYEGGGSYSTLFGHSQREGGRFAGVDPASMTIGEALEFANPSGEYGQWVKSNPNVGRVATPMGKYQIVGTTLRNASKEMGLDPSTSFGPATQDAIAGHLAQRRLAGLDSPAAKRAAMRAEWEGFKHVSDADLDAAIANFEKTGKFGTEGGTLGTYGVASPDGSISRSSPTVNHAGISPGGQDKWSKKREAEEPKANFNKLGQKVGLEGLRNKALAGLGIDDDTAQGIGRVMMGLGGII